MRRVEALDGLRGLAVSVVIAFHLFAFSPGWIGVDIFFVLSGYLITTILLAERSEPKFWSVFYLRRVTRILPAFLAFLALAFSTIPLQPKWMWWLLLFPAANVAATRNVSLDWLGLTVLWSLSVEEHFYLVWPALVRRYTISVLRGVLIALIVLEPALRIAAFLLKDNHRAIYLLTPFRLDGLAIGSLLALALTSERHTATLAKYVQPLFVAALVVFACCLPWIGGDHPIFRSLFLYSFLAILSGLAVAHLVLLPRTNFAKALSWAPLVFLGRISYGLYLIHLFLYFVIARRFGLAHDTLLRPGSLALSILLAWLSFKYYESPILAWGRRRVSGLREERIIAAQSGQ